MLMIIETTRNPEHLIAFINYHASNERLSTQFVAQLMKHEIRPSFQNGHQNEEQESLIQAVTGYFKMEHEPLGTLFPEILSPATFGNIQQSFNSYSLFDMVEYAHHLQLQANFYKNITERPSSQYEYRDSIFLYSLFHSHLDSSLIQEYRVSIFYRIIKNVFAIRVQESWVMSRRFELQRNRSVEYYLFFNCYSGNLQDFVGIIGEDYMGVLKHISVIFNVIFHLGTLQSDEDQTQSTSMEEESGTVQSQ